MIKRLLICTLTLLAFAFFPVAANGADEPPAGTIQVLTTPAGQRFAILGKKGPKPAPTLFVFALSMENTLPLADYNRVGQVLGQKGFLCVSLDLPCHGKDQEPGEPEGLAGWRYRLDKGRPLVQEFVKKASAVLTYLIDNGYTDPRNVGAAGTSRGGFMAIHFAAADPRIGWVIGFAPVTELSALDEFSGLEGNKAIRALDLIHQTDNLAGRGLWICIGNDDRRVGTEQAIALARRITQATIAVTATGVGTPQAIALTTRMKNAGKGDVIPVELHVVGTPGHGVLAHDHDEAARWALSRIEALP